MMRGGWPDAGTDGAGVGCRAGDVAFMLFVAAEAAPSEASTVAFEACGVRGSGGTSPTADATICGDVAGLGRPSPRCVACEAKDEVEADVVIVRPIEGEVGMGQMGLR